VSYSHHKANKLMQIFEEYGDKLFAAGDDGSRSNSPVLANLTYCQALLLLGIPEDEREKFILEHDVKNMTTGELDRATCKFGELIDSKVIEKGVYPIVRLPLLQVGVGPRTLLRWG